MNFCKNCGGSIKDTDKFCGTCGAVIDRNLEYTVPNNQQVQNTQPEVKIPDATPDQVYIVGKIDEIADIKIKEELMKYGIEPHASSLKQTFKGNLILTFIYSIINMLIVSAIFITRLNIILGILLFVVNFFIYYFIKTIFDNDYYILQKVKKNPNEKITTIVNNICDGNTLNTKKYIPIMVILSTLVISIVPFLKPFYIYEKNDTGYSIKYYVEGIRGEEKVVVPSKYKGKDVTIIRGNAFAKSKKIKEVVIPDTIVQINGHAFENNTNLEKVILPNNLEEINGYTFKNDKKLVEINLPSNLKTIGGHAFENCTSLSNITLPNTLTAINGHAFDGATKLNNIELPDSLETIGGGAFKGCTSLTSITIPSKVTVIQGNTFTGCTSLVTVNLHDNITEIHGEVFQNCSSLKNIILPSKITEIRGNTFENCTSLESIEIPYGVTRIGGHAFYGCSSLKSVTLPNSLIEIGSSAFRRCDSLSTISIPRNTIVNERAFKESPTQITRR